MHLLVKPDSFNKAGLPVEWVAALPPIGNPASQHVRSSDFYPGMTNQARENAWPGFFRGQQDVPIRVMLVDDDPHMRRVIVQDLLSDVRIDVVGQAHGVKDARRIMPTASFEVLLLDLNLGDGSGFDIIAEALVKSPSLEVVIISCIDDESNVMKAFSMGATGYIVKSSMFGCFSQVVLQVVNGGSPISPQLARKLLKVFCSNDLRIVTKTPSKAISNLSAREVEILKLVACGHTSLEISTRLDISVQTVSSHVKNVYRKLHIHSRKQAASFLNLSCGFS